MYKVTKSHSSFIHVSIRNYLNFVIKMSPSQAVRAVYSQSSSPASICPPPPTHTFRVRTQNWWVTFKYLKKEKKQKRKTKRQNEHPWSEMKERGPQFTLHLEKDKTYPFFKITFYLRHPQRAPRGAEAGTIFHSETFSFSRAVLASG